MRCAGCNRELEVGDLYIQDTPSGFMGESSEHDDLIAEILGGVGGKVFFCEDCCGPGGDYFFDTVYGDEDEDE